MRVSDESGFTLVELLVALTVGSIIVFVLGQSITLGLRTTTATATTLVDAVNSRALTSDLVSDISSAQALGTSAPPCPDPAPAGTVLWTQGADGAVAVYVVAQTPADPDQNTAAFSQLKRQTCGGQPVTLASWLGVASVPAVLCDGRPECGAQQLLAGDLSASATEVDLAGVTTGLPDPDAGLHPGPYQIRVFDEAMTVTARAVDTAAGVTKLTVTRPSGVAHGVGASVTYKPVSVSVRVPRSDSAACEHPVCDAGDDFNLTVGPASS